jgi:hypothetical protein
MATGANGNQQIAIIDARCPMMHVEAGGRCASAATATVAVQDLPAEAREALSRMCGSPVTGAAEAGNGGEVPPAGAEQGSLFW